MALQFGVTVLPDPPYQRLVELIVKAESLGFDSGWTYDSPILWQEPYPLITLLASETLRMRIGMCVTNPVTREPAVTASAHATGFTPPALAITLTPRSTTAVKTLSIAPRKSRA